MERGREKGRERKKTEGRWWRSRAAAAAEEEAVWKLGLCEGGESIRG